MARCGLAPITGKRVRFKGGRQVVRARSGIAGGRSKFIGGVVAISALAVLVAIPAGPALAKRIVGTSGSDRIVGT